MFGSHLSIAGGLHNALLEAEKFDFEAVQVFTKNQSITDWSKSMNKWRPGARKPTLTKAEVTEIATSFIRAQAAEHESKHGKKFIYELGSVSLTMNTGEWAAVFMAKTDEGHLIDGPAIVLVDDNTRKAKFLE